MSSNHPGVRMGSSAYLAPADSMTRWGSPAHPRITLPRISVSAEAGLRVCAASNAANAAARSWLSFALTEHKDSVCIEVEAAEFVHGHHCEIPKVPRLWPCRASTAEMVLHASQRPEHMRRE